MCAKDLPCASIHGAAAHLNEWEDVQVKQPPDAARSVESGAQGVKAPADEDEWEDV